MHALLVLAALAAADPAPVPVVEFTVPLDDAQRRLAGGGRQSRTDEARCACALPAGFSPDRAWPILVVSSTSDPGYNSSRTWLRERFAGPARAAGWIALAADPPSPQPPAVDTPVLRFALVSAALAELARRYPGAESWPLAFAGFSGGAKHSVFLAAQFARLARPAVGLWLGGCNEDVTGVALDHFGPPRREFRRTLVFLSGGDDDAIATPREQARVEASLRANGFARVRRETYAGGHVFHAPHLEAALAWFDAQRAAGPPR